MFFEVYNGTTRKLVARVQAASELDALARIGVRAECGYYAVLAW